MNVYARLTAYYGLAQPAARSTPAGARLIELRFRNGMKARIPASNNQAAGGSGVGSS